MAFNDKITKVTGIITSIKTKIDELKETYFSKIEELNEKLQGLQDAINENAEETKGKAKKSMQYINTQIKKIQKEYDDIAKSFNDKIEGMKPIIAGELGSKLGLPPDAAEAIASPVVSTLSGIFQFNAPEIQLPELNIPTLPVE